VIMTRVVYVVLTLNKGIRNCCRMVAVVCTTRDQGRDDNLNREEGTGSDIALNKLNKYSWTQIREDI